MNPRGSQVMPAVRPDADVRASASRYTSRPGLFDLYKTSVLVVILCLVYLDIPTYIYAIREGFLPKYFFFVFLIAVAPLLIWIKPLLRYLISPFSLWAFGLIILNIAHLLVALGDGDEARASLIGTGIQYTILTVVLGFACSMTRTTSYERIFPLVAVLIPTMAIMDFLKPGLFYPPGTEGIVAGRAAATFINPNRAGEVMLITLLLAIPVLGRPYRALLLLLTGAGVILTLSRGAILGWILLWVFMLLRKAVPKYTLAIALVGLGALPMLLAGFESYVSGRDDLAGGLDDILGRLDFFQHQTFDDGSALERAQVLEAGLALFLKHPIFGAGAGATHLWSLPVSVHNQPVMLAAEYGVFGIALWLWLAVILWKGKYFQDRTFQLIPVTGFIFLSMFSHNVFDYLYWLMTFAIVSGQRKP
ncbi:MAG: O-antigen ligase family protein [Gammaproteobacteria bacterium]